MYIFIQNFPSNNVSCALLTVYSVITLKTQKSSHDSRRHMYGPECLLFFTLLKNTLISAGICFCTGTQTGVHHLCSMRVCVCARMPSLHCRRGAETGRAKFDICKLNSAQTWQWWSVVHSRRDCLYLYSCPWVLQQACLLHMLQPQHWWLHLLMKVLENQIHTGCMFYQPQLAGERVELACLHLSLWVFLSLCFSL